MAIEQRKGFRIYETDGYELFIEEWDFRENRLYLNSYMVDKKGTRIVNPTIDISLNISALGKLMVGDYSSLSPGVIFKSIFDMGKGTLAIAKANVK